MAATIEDLRKEDLFLSWEGSGIFSNVIAKNGVDADIKLWIQARKYAARIGLSFTFVQGKGTIYSPALDYIRICSEIESDKNHEEWWKMTMRAVLFTMVCTFGTNDYFGHSVYDKYIVDEIDFNTMLDIVNPDFSQFPSDQSIYDHVENVLFEIKEDYHKAYFYRYNVFDGNHSKDDISENKAIEMQTNNTNTVLVTEDEKDAALKAAIENAMNYLKNNRTWFSILKVLVIHEFAIDIPAAADLVKEAVGEEKLAAFKFKINVDDLRKLNTGSMSKPISKWEKSEETLKSNRFETYKSIASIFENALLKAGLIEQTK